MKFIKKHPFLVISLIALLIFIIIGSVAVLKIFQSGTGDLYGNRLDGIENVSISQDKIGELKTDFSKLEYVKSIDYHLKGRLINILIDVTKDTDMKALKEESHKIMNYFTEEQLAFYDIQVFLTCTEDAENEIYPNIGYRHKTTKAFVWTNNK